MRLGPIWTGDNVMSYAEAVSRLNFDKSPGYPLYYECEDKACAFTCEGKWIMDEVKEVLAGKEKWLPATLTLKDELRTADRVRQKKTRVFAASGTVGVTAGKVLFDRQNDKLHDHLGEHPLTIGIPVPGPYFVKTVLSVSSERNVTESDIDGCDQRYPLQLARLVRDLRKAFLPAEYHEAVDLLYDEEFCGDVITEGCVYKMYGNKSGRNNTGDDNGLMQWAVAADYVLATTGCQPKEVDNYFNALFNGDDGVTAWWESLSATGWKEHAKNAFGVIIELGTTEPVYAGEVTFLSHHIRARFVPGLGDIAVAAGNRAKLLASKQWIRRNAEVTFEENCLAHLLGLRICLWPWRDDFMEVEELIDRFVSTVERHPRLDNLLKARIPEQQIIDLHTRLEAIGAGFDGFFPALTNTLTQHGDGVRDLIISAIREVSGLTAMATNNAKELARRKAQSKKDKMAAAHKSKPSPPKGKVKMADDHSRKSIAPAATAYEKSSGFAQKQGKRFKNSIIVEGSDHLEYVVVPTPETVGVVLNEVYISPSEFGGTRLEKYAALYEKFLFEELRFEYVPSVGSNVPGAIVLAYDRDINDPTPPADEQGVRQFTSFEGAVDGNVWTRHVCKARLTQPDDGYYTNPLGEDRLSYQGQFYIALTVPTGYTAGSTLGRLYMHYKCHFFTPQLEGAQNLYQATGNKSAGGTIAPVEDGDWLKVVGELAGPITKGQPLWKPVADSLGRFYLPLAQGVYNIVNTLRPVTPNQTVFTGAGGTAIYGPTVVANEPMPASAPQPWVTGGVGTTQAYGNSGDVFSGATSNYNVAVPRGGAKVYVDYDTNTLTDAGANGFQVEMNVQRLMNYVASPSGLFTAYWRGSDECRNLKKFKTVAE